MTSPLTGIGPDVMHAVFTSGTISFDLVLITLRSAARLQREGRATFSETGGGGGGVFSCLHSLKRTRCFVAMRPACDRLSVPSSQLEKEKDRKNNVFLISFLRCCHGVELKTPTSLKVFVDVGVAAPEEIRAPWVMKVARPCNPTRRKRE